MGTPRDRQSRPSVEAEDQTIQPSELAERHRRTSKSRAPQRRGQPPGKKARQPVRRGGAKAERPKQKELPYEQSTPLVSWLSPDIFGRRLAMAGGMIIIILFIMAGLFMIYQFASGSKFFALRDVEVDGNVQLSDREVEDAVRAIATRGVLRADLDQIRAKLRENMLVKSVEVNRILPDMIRVVIQEREPVALAYRTNLSVACVDGEGRMFGDQSLWRTKPTPPIIRGLMEAGDAAAEQNRQRLLIYKQLMRDLDGVEPALSSRLDEVMFDQNNSVTVILAESAIPVLLGDQDFRVRLNAALDVIDAVKKGDLNALNLMRIDDAEKLLSGKIGYINARIPKRVVVGLAE